MKPIQQGEVYIRQVASLPKETVPMTETDNSGRPILSHSETGNHHVLDRAVDLVEQTQDVPDGMRILMAILDEPTKLIQNASNAHRALELAPGIYEFRISREFDPFAQQARAVGD